MFEAGLQYVRADFHLHTVKDKEFRYSGASDTFVREYVSALKKNNIGVGVITNHNKFDQDEYRALRKAARKQNILLLPGVELTVKEGANGIHTLIVFNPEEWLEKDDNQIQPFLTASFEGILNPENSNEKSNNDLKNTFERLDQYGRDYFVVFAHVDQDCGLFHECNGGLLRTLSRIPSFKNHVLALQKATTKDNLNQFKEQFGYLPAVVEGSDPKSINDIGKGKKSTYIKIGELSYAAVKFSLLDYKERVSGTILENKHGFIESISFQGGKFDCQTIRFSSALNTIIGIRGSGKSSILEAIRYVLGFPAQTDKEYKDNLVKNILESGGKVTLNVVNKHGKQYSLSRILGERTTILDENGRDLDMDPIRLFDGIQYFGQKELSSSTNHETLLLEKILNGHIEKSSDLNRTVKELVESVDLLLDLRKIPKLKDEAEKSRAELKHKLSIYEEKGVATKLHKQSEYTKDITKLELIKKRVDTVLHEIKSVYSRNSIVSNVLEGYSSVFNQEIFNDVAGVLASIDNQLYQIESCLAVVEKQQTELENLKSHLIERERSFADEFAKIKREINDETLDLDGFIKMGAELQKVQEKIKHLSEKASSRALLEAAFKKANRERTEALLKTFHNYELEIKRINNIQSELRIAIEFKGNREAFKTSIKNDFKGTGISDNKYQTICDAFIDYVAIVEDWIVHEGNVLKSILTPQEYVKFDEKLYNQFKDLLAKQVENKVEIYYHGKLLCRHSIGQRASALILFILTQDYNDVLLVDQPEDDLDNKVIYDEVIKAIVRRKPHMQLIFATHNANIPVLGDSERVLALEYQEKLIHVYQGNIDSNETHKKIVDILEGGQVAFDKRKLIYTSWK